MAETTWKLAPIQWDGLRDMRGNFVRWWEGILGAKTREQGHDHIALTVNILWQIWKARNRTAFDVYETDPRETMQKAVGEWNEYIEAQQDITGEFIQQTTISSRIKTWRPPSRGTIKLNTNAAFSQNLERTGIGVVARNAEEELMKVWARAEVKRSEPRVEEAAAIRMGMQMAWKANWRAVELQSDCKDVVDMLNKKQKQQNSIGVILEDIANMRGLFEQCTFSFVHRDGNRCAHSVAKFAVKLTTNVEWDVCFPMWLQKEAQSDLRGSESAVSKSCNIKFTK
ncbi:uncharacterized protein LOC113766348 [Coffea eugenioides]|uniref:uncharacterized protein LOC113766348 n=1 Tax=Coffea eugenioides TaxID=49369 RepID=UPI000F6073D1|nr:uncharacterized protein LOC113766348 [Coffea eugenioides]